MSLQIYTKRDIRDGIASCVGLAVAMSENHALDFMRGVLVHARAQARLYGISWQGIVEEIREEMLLNDLEELLRVIQ